MDHIQKAAAIICGGGIVAFPTETIYGLGANAFDLSAVAKIYTTKGRPSDNPLIVHVSDMQMLRDVVREISHNAQSLIDAFWPGPLSILFEKNDRIPENVTRLHTVAVRMPDHPIALSLIRTAGVPIAAPSANKSGNPSPTSIQHVKEDFPEVYILDGGESQHGVESTVVSVNPPCVLRLGAVTLEDLQMIVPEMALATNAADVPASPGMKYRHYAPKVPLILFHNKEDLLQAAKSNDVIVCAEEYVAEFRNIAPVLSLGDTYESAAKNLFKILRTDKGERILVLGMEKKGLGRTIMDRLERAASEIQ
jgi:L-threonylcarbamoyladenylate synthase